ncbi:DEAD/DEAH box helicase [Burkholderia vietnamiensis]|jgi:ATP-dependent RNA helicase RhlE|uniref:ATP-dependent RNA helicase RhlE n=2 Tax=Burkholderia vietnamiensis TaxID=60552 RepID=A4JHM0_BURVG|nr:MULTISPECIES: DEAD/DEAH box helicase [Burkholderia]ABO55773.1 DEAD/DEAH box helicase domain protein [Burkholderia vietnamiensis G4]AFJ86793.1 ATP-dependent RNA helicase RhlE [Burkholderia sp. KJ006]AOK11019.1 RNA helicase [Burkholderia vietnamiensis]AOK41855.1 RNA helicase [Burkholderia vietnamiensis]KKI39590.1 RNA helicase [Burkholderia vietnamiensis]
MSFESLGLAEPLVKAVNELGYTSPTPIQQQAIPAVLGGGDLLAGAQTGTGKTAGFTLPILQRLHTFYTEHRGAKRAVRALILTPTRELAAQVEESVRAYSKYVKLRSTVMFGGVSINPQIDALKRGVDIVVATPGRLLDHMQQKTIDLSDLDILVLDEADRMLDMGFIHDIKRVLAKLPPRRQNLLFSATFSDEIKALADSLLDSPALIEVARRNTTAETVAQKIHPVDRDRKRELLTHLIREHNWFQVLVFTRTKHGANRLAEQLTKDGISAMAIHGNKSQSARTRALAEFKNNTLQVLVATDIAARGIDIDQLPHVVNFDLPNVPEDYVHRIGRTGRAGATGEAVSLVCVDEKQLLRDIERLIKREIPQEVIAGFEPDPNVKPEPIQQRRGQQPRGGGNGGGGGGGGGNRQPRAGGSGQAGAKRDANAQPKAAKAAKPRAAGGASGNANGGGRPAGGGNGARPANGNAAHPNRNRSSRSGQRGH